MGCFKPTSCPECKLPTIDKEVFSCFKIDYWVCKSCGDCGPHLDEPLPAKKNQNGNKKKE